jgi:hypothetical protein
LVPDEAPKAILAEYQARKDEAGFDLSAFVNRHFSMPTEGPNVRPALPGEPLETYVARLWDVLRQMPAMKKPPKLPEFESGHDPEKLAAAERARTAIDRTATPQPVPVVVTIPAVQSRSPRSQSLPRRTKEAVRRIGPSTASFLC